MSFSPPAVINGCHVLNATKTFLNRLTVQREISRDKHFQFFVQKQFQSTLNYAFYWDLDLKLSINSKGTYVVLSEILCIQIIFFEGQ